MQVHLQQKKKLKRGLTLNTCAISQVRKNFLTLSKWTGEVRQKRIMEHRCARKRNFKPGVNSCPDFSQTMCTSQMVSL